MTFIFFRLRCQKIVTKTNLALPNILSFELQLHCIRCVPLGVLQKRFATCLKEKKSLKTLTKSLTSGLHFPATCSFFMQPPNYQLHLNWIFKVGQLLLYCAVPLLVKGTEAEWRSKTLRIYAALAGRNKGVTTSIQLSASAV